MPGDAGATGLTVHPTAAPATIGALAASYGAIELGKLIAGCDEQALIGRELYVDALHHQHFVTEWRRNPECRFDHLVRVTSPLEGGSLRSALATVAEDDGRAWLAVEGDVFVAAPRCRTCGAQTPVYALRTRTAPRCAGCGAALEPAGVELLEALSREDVPPERAGWALATFGLRGGDIVTLGSTSGRHFRELGEVARPSEKPGAAVVLAGCGNVGSHLVPLLARMPGVAHITLVDPDVYEAANLAGQQIRPGDVGRSKVEVQAERIVSLSPGCAVEVHATTLEAVPNGRLRDAVLISALDSRRARMELNWRAARVGATWVDMAVEGASMRCRIGVFRPAPDTACIECGWGPDTYARLEQRLACAAPASRPPLAPDVVPDACA